MAMAKVAGTFESIVGAYFDDFIAPLHEVSGVPAEDLLRMRGKYVQDVAENEKAIAEIEDIYGVTII